MHIFFQKTVFFKSVLFALATLQFFIHQSEISAKSHYKYDLAICAIFQNEELYLKEWIEFHKLIGVQHFYLYDNLSTDNYEAVLKPYIQSGEVELISWPYSANQGRNWTAIQSGAYKDALKHAKGKVKWLAILDTDEFLFPVETTNCIKFLKEYEKPSIGGVCVNWQLYGTSRISKCTPDQFMIEQLLLKAPTDYYENMHVKSIVRPEYVTDCKNPHYCVYKIGYTQVTSNKTPFKGCASSSVAVDKSV